jgi:hypothetical protein
MGGATDSKNRPAAEVWADTSERGIMSDGSVDDAPNTGRLAVQKAALIVGVLFLVIGGLGFVPGVTANLGSITLASHHSDAMLFGIFQVSIVHNIMHLLFGVTGVAMARTMLGAHRYLLLGGLSYLVLFVYGLLISQSTNVNFLPVNPADDVLHLLLGSTMVMLGSVLNRRILMKPGRHGVFSR